MTKYEREKRPSMSYTDVSLPQGITYDKSSAKVQAS
jgi:hypothetical protein